MASAPGAPPALSSSLRALLARHAEERSERASALRSAREAVASLSDEVAGNARACLGQELRSASAGARAVEAGFVALAAEARGVARAGDAYARDYAALAAAVKDLGSLAGWLATSEACLKQTVAALEASAAALTTDDTQA
jgi:hypothetical protein